MMIEKTIDNKVVVLTTTILLIALGHTILDMYVPSFPAITKDLLTSSDRVQLSMSLHLLGVSLSQLFYGPLSDRYGRRTIILVGTAITLLGTLLAIVAQSVDVLIAARFIQGFGFGVGAVLGRSILRDTFSNRELAKYGSYTGLAGSISLGLAPTIGGLIEQVSHWRVSFVFILLMLVFLFIFVYRYLPETNKSLDKQAIQVKQIFYNYLQPLKIRAFWGYSFCAGLAFSGMITYATISPFILQVNFGLSPAHFGMLSLLIALALASAFLINSRIVLKYGINKVLAMGMSFMLLGAVFLLTISFLGYATAEAVMIAIFIYAVGAGFVYSNAFAGAFGPFSKGIGSVASVYGMIQMGVGGLTGFVISFIPSESALIMGIIFTILAVMANLSLYILVKTPKRKIQAPNMMS